MSRLQNHLRFNADIARQRSEAVRLAQQDLEASRTFASLSDVKTGHSYSDIADSSIEVVPGAERAGNTNFRIDRSIVDGTGFRTASVTVDWADRTGHGQQVVLHSVIAATPPALSGSLTLAAAAPSVAPARGRSALIPVTAKDLGNGTSALKPSDSLALAFIFDNASGRVTSRCEHVAADLRTADLGTTSLVDCTPMNGMLLSGVVRVSLAMPPEAAHPADKALPLDVDIAFSGSAKPDFSTCIATESERAVAYHCVIAPASGRWSGRSSLVPRGWALGLTAADKRVCRYSADNDGSGAIDSNAEHPDEYKNVDRSLMQQNFLVIRGDQSCPVAAKGEAVFADISTVQHQP